MIEKFKEYLIKKYPKYSYLTIKNYISQINNFLETYNLNLEKLSYYLSLNPVPIRRASIFKFLEFLEQEGKDIKNLKEEIKKIEVKQNERESSQTLEIERGEKLIKKLLELKKDKLAVIIMICYDTGARIRAVLKIRKKNIEILNNGVYINLEEKRKKKIRRLITQNTFNHLQSVFNLEELNDDSYLFVSKNKTQITDKELDRIYHKYWNELKNISKKYFGDCISFHWLRRGAGVYIYDKTGKDIVATSDFLGHEDAKVTKKYLKIQAERGEEIIRKTKRNW